MKWKNLWIVTLKKSNDFWTHVTGMERESFQKVQWNWVKIFSKISISVMILFEHAYPWRSNSKITVSFFDMNLTQLNFLKIWYIQWTSTAEDFTFLLQCFRFCFCEQKISWLQELVSRHFPVQRIWTKFHSWISIMSSFQSFGNGRCKSWIWISKRAGQASRRVGATRKSTSWNSY